MTTRAKIIIGILLLLLVGAVTYYLAVLRWERVSYYGSEYGESEGGVEESCNVMGINLHGDLYTYIPYADSDYDYASGEDIYYTLEQIEEDPDYENIKVVVLEVDSYGGSPVAAEELANKIKNFKLPVIAMIRSSATSGAYWVASAGDRVFASRLSEVGGIGVTMSYLDESGANEESGYVWNDLSTGKFKDSGNEQKPLTDEERVMFERDLNIIHEEFVKAVAENRGIPEEKVRELADGSLMLGQMALEKGLIDEIGFMGEVKEYIKTKYVIEPEICW